MKVRKHDVMEMLKFNTKILEFHFSDSDLNLELDTNFDQQLIVHCYEYFNRKIVDLVALGETNQIHSKETSIELVQKAIEALEDCECLIFTSKSRKGSGYEEDTFRVEDINSFNL